MQSRSCTVKQQFLQSVHVFVLAPVHSAFDLTHIHVLCFHPWPCLVHVKVSNLVKTYNREDITVWASVNSRIMKRCRTVVHEPPGGDRVTFASFDYWFTGCVTFFIPSNTVIAWSKQVELNFKLCLENLVERLHAVQLHCEPRCAAAAPLLQRPAALCTTGWEFTAVLPAQHHQQVRLQERVHVESVCVCVCWCIHRYVDALHLCPDDTTAVIMSLLSVKWILYRSHINMSSMYKWIHSLYVSSCLK